MATRIHYIINVNAGDRPFITGTTEPELESLFKSLRNLQVTYNGGLEILDAKRCVVSSSGKVTYIQATLTLHDGGLEIHDIYGNLLDSYTAPEPGKKRYKVVRNEIWTNEIDVEAESEDDAIKIVDKLVADGGFDVLDGWCTDVDHEVYDA